MTEPPKDRLSPISSADLDESSPFNLAFQTWRRGDPSPLAIYIRENGISNQWEANVLADIVSVGDRLLLRKNETEREALWLRLYAHIKRCSEGEPSWEEIYRRVAETERTTPEAVKKLRKRLGIK